MTGFSCPLSHHRLCREHVPKKRRRDVATTRRATGDDELAEVVYDAWLARAPKRMAAAWLAERGLG